MPESGSAERDRTPDFGPYCNGCFISPDALAEDVAFATELAQSVAGLHESNDSDAPFYPVAIRLRPQERPEAAVRRCAAIDSSLPLRVRKVNEPASIFMSNVPVRERKNVWSADEQRRLSDADKRLRAHSTDTMIMSMEDLVHVPLLRVGRTSSGTLVGVVTVRVDT